MTSQKIENLKSDERIHQICTAPMMGYTDRFFRYLVRALGSRAFLYTEMISADALLFGKNLRNLKLHPSEHPVALQLGGNDPKKLALAAQRGAQMGFDEINFNMGCPSHRVASGGAFGAFLMKNLPLAVRCVSAMREASAIPVTVKCRIGVDDQDSYPFLLDCIGQLAKQAGCHSFVIHARKALLSGLTPKQNRTVPTLNPERVYRIKKAMPRLEIILNGGVDSILTTQRHLKELDGVMLGRAAYHHPLLLLELQQALSHGKEPEIPLRETLYAMHRFAAAEIKYGTPLQRIVRPLAGIFRNKPHAAKMRNLLQAIGEEGNSALPQLLHLADQCVI